MDSREHDEAWQAAQSRPAIALPLLAITTNQLLASGRYLLLGASFHASGGGGTVILYDGLDTNGRVVMNVGVGAGGTLVPVIGTPGVRCSTGLFISISGFTSMSGAVWAVPVVTQYEGEANRYAHEAMEASSHGAAGAEVHSHYPSQHSAVSA